MYYSKQDCKHLALDEARLGIELDVLLKTRLQTSAKSKVTEPCKLDVLLKTRLQTSNNVLLQSIQCFEDFLSAKNSLKFRVSNNPIGRNPIISLQIFRSLQCCGLHCSRH